MRVSKEKDWEINVEFPLTRSCDSLLRAAAAAPAHSATSPALLFPCPSLSPVPVTAEFELPAQNQRICAPTESPVRAESPLVWLGQGFVQSRALNHHPLVLRVELQALLHTQIIPIKGSAILFPP